MILKEKNEILQSIRPARTARNLSQSQLGVILGVKGNTVSGWELSIAEPKPEALERIKAWLSQEETPLNAPLIKEAQDHVDQMKRLLNSMEYELRYFANGKSEARDIFRRELDAYDIGYLVSLLEMMADEGKFQRWKIFTNYQFNSFRRVRRDRKGKDKS